MNGQPQGQVLSRDASRELDALIAEKVMGLRVNRRDRGGWTVYDANGSAWRSSVSGIYCNDLPEFSTDIAAAWLVVEGMARRGWIIDVQNRQVVRWACHVHFPAPDYRKVFECEDTAPLAICRAALAAMEAV